MGLRFCEYNGMNRVPQLLLNDLIKEAVGLWLEEKKFARQ